jgi:hypothetical protein
MGKPFLSYAKGFLNKKGGFFLLKFSKAKPLFAVIKVVIAYSGSSCCFH